MTGRHGGFGCANALIRAAWALWRVCSAGDGGIRHLLCKDVVAMGAWAQSRPIASGSKQGLVEIDELVFHDADSAAQIVFGLQDGLAGIVHGEGFVMIPVEIAAIAVGVFIGELKEAFTADHAMADFIGHGYFRLGVANVGGGFEAGLCTGESLEEICPKGALVGVR